jgi:ribosomal protein L29
MKAIKELPIKSSDVLTQLDIPALKKELQASKKYLYTMKMKLALGELKQTHLVRYMRRYTAHLATLINLKR